MGSSHRSGNRVNRSQLLVARAAKAIFGKYMLLTRLASVVERCLTELFMRGKHRRGSATSAFRGNSASRHAIIDHVCLSINNHNAPTMRALILVRPQSKRTRHIVCESREAQYPLNTLHSTDKNLKPHRLYCYTLAMLSKF